MGFFDRLKRSKKFECDHLKSNKIITSLTEDNGCHKKGKYVWYECLHPPSKEYNQHDGKYGVFLGPYELTPWPSWKYSKDPNDDSNKLDKYFFCAPSHKDDHHYIVRSCKEHHMKPVMLKFEVQAIITEKKMMNQKEVIEN